MVLNNSKYMQVMPASGSLFPKDTRASLFFNDLMMSLSYQLRKNGWVGEVFFHEWLYLVSPILHSLPFKDLFQGFHLKIIIIKADFLLGGFLCKSSDRLFTN